MLPWRRHRRTTARLDPTHQADAWQLCSLLLDYPEEALFERLPVLREAAAGLPSSLADPFLRFLGHAEEMGLAELQVDYVDTFDVTRKCSLHLTYFLHGDTRNRGVALVRFKQLYREHGVELGPGELAVVGDGLAEPGDRELPDFLPVVLEFGATVAPDAAWKLLNDHRVGIELLHRALERRDSPWLAVVNALRATLPQLEGDDEQALLTLIAQGPPQELVGLDDDALNAPYAQDPGLDQARGSTPYPPSGCGDHARPAARPTSQHLGPSIPVGAPR
ncbi:nitrate reductase molybdenum cofactor assembly chaperone [Ornithinimicrobium sp. Y1847]|uniref:nitrate reductase molybdenum cofactor assembly chaperone n=1 Tax=Ornithinimicrobium sp. Y1847 TaxID=3405419 RepID=UPI003B671EC4